MDDFTYIESSSDRAAYERGKRAARNAALEEAAQVAEAYPKKPPFGWEYTATGMIGEGQDNASRDIAAAIRARKD